MELLRSIASSALIFFYNITNDYGMAIILLTVSVRLVTLPLTIKQTKSSKVMQELGPEQKRIQEKYKDNKDKMNQELMELYKKHNFNPLSGCLPLLVQLPVIIAVFGVLRNPAIMEASVEAFSPYFLGILNLNNTFAEIVAQGGGYVLPAIIPLLAGATTYYQTKLTSAGQSTQGGMGAMTKMMPIMIVVFSYSMPQGLPLYWLAGNVFSIVQHLIVNRPNPVVEGGE